MMKRWSKTILMMLCMGVIAFGAPVNAQDTSLPESGTETGLLTEDEAFAAVFADPGNIQLNFQLVGVQLRNQHFKEAAGTLERILILLPDNPSAQLLLTRVQVQLGNLPEAQRLAGLLADNEQASEEQKSAARALTRQIESSQQRFSLSGAITIGGGVTDNPDGGSIENAYLAAGTYGTEGHSKRANAEEFLSTNFILSGRGKLTSQLPEDVTLSLTGSTKDYAHYDSGDMSSLGLSASYANQGQSSLLRLQIGTNRLHVNDEHYLNSFSTSVSLINQFGSGWAGNSGISAVRSVYKKSFSDNNSAKTANVLTLNLGLSKQVGNGSLQTALSASNTDARADDNDKTGGSASMSYFLPSAYGLFSAGISHRQERYKTTNSAYSDTIKRRDETNTVNLGYALGLSSLAAPQPDEPSLRLTTRYGKTKSTIANFSKYNGEAAINLTSPF